MKQINKIYNENSKLIALIIKGVTGVLGASLILQEGHPYLTLAVLSIGAGVNEYLLFIEKNDNL